MFESFTVHRMSSPTDPHTGRVLVADDQPDVLEALRWLLDGRGLSCRSSSAPPTR
jgi:PleD family two-component response regulator